MRAKKAVAVLALSILSLLIGCRISDDPSNTDEIVSTPIQENKLEIQRLFACADRNLYSQGNLMVNSFHDGYFYLRPMYEKPVVRIEALTGKTETFDVLSIPDKNYIKPVDGGLLFTKAHTRSLFVYDLALSLVSEVVLPDNYGVVFPASSSSDLRYILISALESDGTIADEFDICLYDRQEETIKPALPPNEYYYWITLLMNDTKLFADCYGTAGGRDYLLYDVQTEVLTKIGDEALFGGQTQYGQDCSPYILFDKGYYDMQVGQFIPINFPRFTVTPDGVVYYIESNQLISYNPVTSQSVIVGELTGMGFENVFWLNAHTSDKLLAMLWSSTSNPNGTEGVFLITIPNNA